MKLKKNLVVLAIGTIFTLSGCSQKKQNEQVVVEQKPTQEVTKKEVKEEVITPVEEPKVNKKKRQKPIKYTYYRMITNKIEVFPYNLRKGKLIDDKKLKSSFYLSGDKIRIEKIYQSKIGDRYGKIAGKKLIVSMDDLSPMKK